MSIPVYIPTVSLLIFAPSNKSSILVLLKSIWTESAVDLVLQEMGVKFTKISLRTLVSYFQK